MNRLVSIERREIALTNRQREVLDTITDFIKHNGRPPTLREIGELTGISSTNGVNDHLVALEKKGCLERSPGLSRGLTILDPDGRVPEPVETLRIPVLGRIAAGSPILAEENIEEHIEMPASLPGLTLQDGTQLYALKVRGDSMIGDGIFDGDMIFVKPARTAKDGEIVVALVDSDATVKRFYSEEEYIRLQPSNDDMEPIMISREDGRDTIIQGIVIAVYRHIS